jgi:hypothetical protein
MHDQPMYGSGRPEPYVRERVWGGMRRAWSSRGGSATVLCAFGLADGVLQRLVIRWGRANKG